MASLSQGNRRSLAYFSSFSRNSDPSVVEPPEQICKLVGRKFHEKMLRKGPWMRTNRRSAVMAKAANAASYEGVSASRRTERLVD